MWNVIIRVILKNRKAILFFLAAITLFMGYRATKIELSYQLAEVLPKDNETYKDYVRFKKLFGEDGNVLVLGFKNEKLFDLNVYNDWIKLGNTIRKINGVKEILSAGNYYDLKYDSVKSVFQLKKSPEKLANSQLQADSIASEMRSLLFYKNLIINEENATLMAVTFDKKNLNSKLRIEVVKEIKKLTGEFSANHKIEMHYSGMPYIRTEFMNKVSDEMKLFLFLAFLVTTSILFGFFRSHLAVFFSSMVILIGVVCSLGTIELLGYKITLLSGLIPPLIMIIAVPNCIFLINKYVTELTIHGNQAKALARAIEKVGLSLLLANVTTAIGFGVFYFTNSNLLKEFGVVAAINVTATYVVSMLFIPIVFSYLSVPDLSHAKRKQSILISRFLSFVDRIVHSRRKRIYFVISILVLISVLGITKATVKGYLVDDLPKNHPIYHDLRFFESNFNGVLPFEILIDSKKEGGITNPTALYKMNALQKQFSKYSEFSKPMSLVEIVKFSYQKYRGGKEKYYALPGALELKELSEKVNLNGGKFSNIAALTDSSKTVARISYQMADVGSIRMKEIVTALRSKADSLFEGTDYKASFTGYSQVFLKSNDYLLENLFESLGIAILLITLVGLALFKSLRIILLSKVPCLIPLIFTAGIMGYFNIFFKPSTILIFSIAFGISSDGTIYFLTKYREELLKHNDNSKAISATIKETGVGMIYTTIILFFGFGIFIFSGFLGTVALGVLISTTIAMALFTNLILLPSFLLSIDKHIQKRFLSKNKDKKAEASLV